MGSYPLPLKSLFASEKLDAEAVDQSPGFGQSTVQKQVEPMIDAAASAQGEVSIAKK
jgi:hypothetical protein